MKVRKKVLMYNPAISSLNMGDHIIGDGAYNQLQNLLEEAFVVDVSTHLPVSRYLRHTEDFNYKFVCGSNLIRGKMNRLFRQWDINLLNSNLVGPCILVGVGWWQYGDEPNIYTKKLYQKVLSKDYIHSVRDAYTEQQFKKMGIHNVINTSCPTMWNLTKNHCEEIPVKKSKNVICTITDYNKDHKRDSELFEILFQNYDNVYFWIQGTQDYEYFQELKIDHSKVIIVNPNLKSYDEVLKQDIDYVGTRLHAGVRALQNKKRTIIIGIDNRAIEKQKDFNLTCISRENLDLLKEKINSTFATQINIPIENINKWKSQFD
ncbi:polysaccharide pyruvyl transferase family protein [Exiguobacterium sp. s50]|uniref:polysaccharide pyruvyl transferase family protein n=1 Tax=Exiguobacterium sp. s50 TaxID=2751234 RepID=UPI001BEC17D9|nr:polysaccharide pyruvyl transferase family protein [Exiguobacterium sp. s50]